VSEHLERWADEQAERQAELLEELAERQSEALAELHRLHKPGAE
jgi:predicted nucleic acid-binding Zn ribbon protein